MTTANKITLVRIAMIPFFVVFALMDGVQWQGGARAQLCLGELREFIEG